MKNLNLLIIIVILVFVNLIGSSYFSRIDLTKEGRYSLSAISVETMEKLEYPFYMEIYLEGDFPANIRRFQDALRTTVVELQQYSEGSFDFEFIDPSGNPSLMADLRKRGFPPIPVQVRVSNTETQRKDMFPVAVLHYRDNVQYVDLLKGCAFPNGQVNFGKAEADLEYKLVSAIRNLNRTRRGLIAVLQGHGEHEMTPIIQEAIGPDGKPEPRVVDVRTEMRELLNDLDNGYNIAPINLADHTENGEISPSIDLLMILQPTTAFSEREKYEIDQYLMRGGNVLWILDQEVVDLDLFEKRSTLTQLYDLNLDDLFMHYGVKVNYDLVQDLSCEPTEVFNTEAEQFESKRWIFHPLLFSLPNHPVTRNVDAVLLRNAASIDTFPQAGVKKSAFIQSSPYSRTVQGTQFIDLNMLLENPPPQNLFNKGGRIMGLMMEGSFESLFKGREAPTDSVFPQAPSATFLERSDMLEQMSSRLAALDSNLKDQMLTDYLARTGKGRRMAIISDGEFVMGKQFRGKRGNMPYDNKTLLLNTIDYLVGDQTLTDIRSKEVVARRLDPDKIRGKVGLIQGVNLIFPILLVLAFGVVRYLIRKRNQEKVKRSD